MNPNNSDTIPSQYYSRTNHECVLKPPDHGNSSANNEVHSIINSVTNDINSKWDPALVISPSSGGPATETHANTEASPALIDRRIPALTNCVCQNDMNAASPNTKTQTEEQKSTGSRPQTNFSLGPNDTGPHINSSPPDSGWACNNLSLTRGVPFTNSMHGGSPGAHLSSITSAPFPKSGHAVINSTSVSGKPPLYPVRRHANPATGIHVPASTSVGFYNKPTGPSSNANWTNYRARGMQPPANSPNPNISGNNSMEFSGAPISLTIPKTPSNQNSMLAQDMQQLQQTLQPSPTCQPTKAAVRGICAQIMQHYLSYWNSRPADNNILFWRSFVAKYYAVNSKRRTCTSTCKDKTTTSLQNHQQKWQCGFCKEYSDKTSEISFDKMAETFQKQFESNAARVLLSLGPGEEKVFNSGGRVVHYKRVVQHVMRQSGYYTTYEGPLMILFNTELKIYRWDFCVRHTEQFISRKVLGSQMDELLQAVAKHEEPRGENESGRDPQHEEKIVKLIYEFANSRKFQIPQGIASMNSTQNTINPTGRLQKINPTSDPMPQCGNTTLNPNPLKRNFPGDGLDREPQHGHQVSRRRFEASPTKNNSNNNALANMTASTSNNDSNNNSPADMATTTSKNNRNNNVSANMAASTSNNHGNNSASTNMAITTIKNNSSNNALANMAASTSNNDSNNNASANLAEDELLRQKHHAWFERMIDKLLAVENPEDLKAFLASITD